MRWIKKQNIWIAAAVASVVVMAVIFFFSSQPVVDSDRLSKGFGRKLMEWFPALGARFTLSELDHYLRKSAHFAIYFILGFCLTVAAGRQKKLPPAVVSVGVGVIFAASDEIHQFFSDGRGPMIKDVILDSFGVAAGSALSLLCGKIVRSMRGKR